MAMRVFNVGDVLAAADVNEYLVNTRYVAKPADTSRASNTTLASDPDLTLPVDANKTYYLEALVQYTAIGGSAGDIKVAWAVPAGAVFNGQSLGLIIGGAGLTQFPYQSIGNVPGAVTGFGGGGGLMESFRLSVAVVTSSTAGNLTLQWAQNTSNGTATVVKQGSFLFLRRVA